MTGALADPDRLLPVDPRERAVARELYDAVADAPIVSPHGHVDPRILVDDAAFPDPAALLVTSDHYVLRLLHAAGIPLDALGRGDEPGNPRDVWRAFCAHWPWFAGTASGGWLRDTLGTLFDVDEPPSAASADALYDRIASRLAAADFRPRALFARFRIDVLATTDDPLDDLAPHAALAARPGSTALPGRVIPTFRPDAYLDPASPGWAERVQRLAEVAGTRDDYDGFLAALVARRAHFVAHGAVSADHGVESARTLELSATAAASIFDAARAGRAEHGELAALRAHLLLESARMSVDDGLVMTIHAGVLRGHHRPTTARFGPDTGHDLPVPTGFTRELRPLLERFGAAAGFHLVLFAVDETTFSRELAPLAGFYPSVFIGAPWWFLDAPDAIRRFRAATIETAGFHRGSGFIDDTRAFLSIPARHDASRRIDAGVLARLVGEGRVTLGEARQLALDLVDAIPRRAFKL